MQFYHPANSGPDLKDPMANGENKGFSAFRTPIVLLLLSLSLIAGAWCWLGTPVTLEVAPIDVTRKVDCVSYAPFREGQTPWNSQIVISEAQIAEDLAQLAGISKCVRIYSLENGLDKVPELAAKVGLKVILGVWIGRNPLKNAALIDDAVLLVKQHPGVITSVIIGSEVLLRGEMTLAALRETIRAAKPRFDVPISYAEVQDIWLRDREIANDIDFVTVHVLPYWEDEPVRAEDAAAHVDDIRKEMARAFPGKEILIGEAGWPSRGRMRDHALPSRINQARFFSELLTMARQEGFRVNLFEAYDEPWKRQWEGTVGAHWGLLDGVGRQLKYATGAAVSNFPFWKLQMGAGLVLSLALFAAALLTRRGGRSAAGFVSWLAVATCATSGGILVGLAAEKALDESYGFDGWLLQGLLLAAGVVLPLFCANAVMAGRPQPAFAELFGPRDGRTRSRLSLIFGLMSTVAILVAAETALGLVFDPRSRDFPFASLTMFVVPILIVARLNPRRRDTSRVAEGVFACLFVGSALYIFFNEGVRNWQSLWTSATFLLLGISLSPPRALLVVSAIADAVLPRLFGRQEGEVQPVAVESLPQPTSKLGAATSFVVASSRMERDK
ncbi:glycosyl hydrolase family 17 protein [Bradyrhizobium sp. Tv2a-2]|uniref:glycoside hydrolase family 17 protein n=1 Tax=Bradyrhizobium sp. Tv2a-2 TaxID=113395 RepID=UPI0003FBFA31|nr:glycosyl hydrolase family 17 protein [Bradyrhizobium sp. Tv2a-2]